MLFTCGTLYIGRRIITTNLFPIPYPDHRFANRQQPSFPSILVCQYLLGLLGIAFCTAC
jgi:hypothetical protein